MMGNRIGDVWPSKDGNEVWAGDFGWVSEEEYKKHLQSGAVARGQQEFEGLLRGAVGVYNKVGEYIPDIELDQDTKENLRTAKDVAGHVYNWTLRPTVDPALTVLGFPVEAAHYISKKVDTTGRGIGKGPLSLVETIATAGGPTLLKGGKTLLQQTDNVAAAVFRNTDNLALANAGSTTSGAFLSVNAGENVSKSLGLGLSSDPLTKSVQPVSEILPHKSLREAGGVGARNLHQAVTVQKLIIQKIGAAMNEAPNFVREMFEEIWPNVDASKLTVLEMKNKLAKALGSKTKAQGPITTKNLDRGLAEILAGRPEFLDDIGVIEEVIKNPSVLEPKNISKWLGGIDSRVSSTKSGIALHHTHLTSPKDLLDPSNVSDSWRKTFLKKAREKFTPGAEGIVKQDALAHKPFSSPKINGKTDSSKWNVKGVLGDVLDEFTDLPKSTTGDIVVRKEIGKLGNYSKGLEGQLQKLIRSINEKAAHAHWSRGTTGWSLDKRLGRFSPDEAFEVAEHIFDLERVVSEQGILVTRKLNNWKKAVSKGTFGDPPNLEKAIATLQKNIDNIKIDEKRIKAMEELYQNDLDALLTRGSKGLKIEQTKGSHPFNTL